MAMLHPSVLEQLKKDPAYVAIAECLSGWTADTTSEQDAFLAHYVLGYLAGAKLLAASSVPPRLVVDTIVHVLAGERNFRKTGGHGGKPVPLAVYDALSATGDLKKPEP